MSHEQTFILDSGTPVTPITPPPEISPDPCVPSCVQTCDWVFQRVQTRPTVKFGTSVEWLIHPQFEDPTPHTFQLQVGHTANPEADDWTNVGLPANNVSYLVDDEQRVYGNVQWTHYRIKLITPYGTYYSRPEHAFGVQAFRWWRLWLARERQWLVSMQQPSRGAVGYLLKRKLVGENPEPEEFITDYLTEEITNPQAEATRGTEFLGGYYAPIPCVYALSEELVARMVELDGDKGGRRGTINDPPKLMTTFMARPMVDDYDVWVDAQTDHRWVIRGVKHREEIGGIPIVVNAQIRLLPFSHPVYKIPMVSEE